MKSKTQKLYKNDKDYSKGWFMCAGCGEKHDIWTPFQENCKTPKGFKFGRVPSCSPIGYGR